MGVLQIVWSGGIRRTHRIWLTEVTIIRGVQARLASLLLPRLRLLARKVLASLFWSKPGLELSFFIQRFDVHV